MEIGVQIIYIYIYIFFFLNNGNAIFISTLASGLMFKVRSVFLTKESIAFCKRLDMLAIKSFFTTCLGVKFWVE